jgi:hypothetical protein
MTKRITSIVFTKNRPLQLHGYLESLQQQLSPSLVQTVILYKVDRFREEYNQLFQQFSDCIVIRESNYYTDLNKIIDQAQTDYILFGVDDVILFDHVNIDVVDAALSGHNQEAFGFSLRLNRDWLTEHGQTVEPCALNGHDLWSVSWQDAKTPDARYPFDLSASIYSTRLLQKIHRGSRPLASRCERLLASNPHRLRQWGKRSLGKSFLKRARYFYDPNTHEAWTHRWCRRNAGQLPPKLFFQRQCACALHLNQVNESIKNTTVGNENHTVDYFNEQYQKGFRLDINHLAANKPSLWELGPEYCILHQPVLE